MRQNLNEEISKMKSMMGLQEQSSIKDFWNNKVKPAAEKAGSAIKTGVHNASQKISDLTQDPNTQQGQSTEVKYTLDQVRSQWKNKCDVSSDMAYGEESSRDLQMVPEIASHTAQTILAKKLNININRLPYKEIFSKTFQSSNGLYTNVTVIQKS